MKQNPYCEAVCYSVYRRNSPPVMKPESSLTRSQELASGRYPEPQESSPHLPLHLPTLFT